MNGKYAVKLLIVIVGLSLCSPVSAQAPEAKPAQNEAPRMEFVYEETVTLGAGMHPGPTPFGERNIVPITGGTLSGPKLHGKILPGGWDWQLAGKKWLLLYTSQLHDSNR